LFASALAVRTPLLRASPLFAGQDPWFAGQDPWASPERSSEPILGGPAAVPAFDTEERELLDSIANALECPVTELDPDSCTLHSSTRVDETLFYELSPRMAAIAEGVVAVGKADNKRDVGDEANFETERAVRLSLETADAADTIEGLSAAVELARSCGLDRSNKLFRKCETRLTYLQDCELDAVGEEEDDAGAGRGHEVEGAPPAKRRSPEPGRAAGSQPSQSGRPVATPQRSDGSRGVAGVGGGDVRPADGAVQQPSDRELVTGLAPQQPSDPFPEKKPSWVDDVIIGCEDRITAKLGARLSDLSIRAGKLEARAQAQEQVVAGHEKRIKVVEAGLVDQQAMRKEWKDDISKAVLAAKVAPSTSTSIPSTGVSSKEFVPQKIDLKGACGYGKAATEGLTRQFMEKYAALLTSKLPPALRGSVGEYALRGLDDLGERGGIATFTIIKPTHLSEILGIWSKKLRNDPELVYKVAGEERKLFVVADRSEPDRIRYRAMGKVKEKVLELREKQAPNMFGNVKVEWKPDFSVKDADSMETIIYVQPNGAVVVEDTLCRKFLGVAGNEFKRLAAGTL